MDGHLGESGMTNVIKFARKTKRVGTDINNAACDQTRILYALEFAKKQELEAQEPIRNKYQAGTALELRILASLQGQPYHICCDAAFTSVTSTAALKDEYRMYFTGIVKTAHKYFPSKYLKSVETQERGDGVNPTTDFSIKIDNMPVKVPVIAHLWDDTFTNNVKAHGKRKLLMWFKWERGDLERKISH
ncbi:unnamed protein product [Discosporangium mesarthrocarpum]